MGAANSFDEYLGALGRLTAHIDPTASTPQAEGIKESAESLAERPVHSVDTLTTWLRAHPREVPVLGLVVGLSQEKLKNSLKNRFDTSGWYSLARECPEELVAWFDTEYDLVRLLNTQSSRTYTFGDVLVARAGTRVTATSAGQSGRRVEDEIEAIARELGLEYETRTRFTGRHGRDAPCDLVVTKDGQALIAVAAKGFDSTGSKLTDAVREIEEMADVRLPSQFIMAVVDGIGWMSRKADLRRIHGLWDSQEIDGLYTLATLDAFRDDLEHAARLRGLL